MYEKLVYIYIISKAFLFCAMLMNLVDDEWVFASTVNEIVFLGINSSTTTKTSSSAGGSNLWQCTQPDPCQDMHPEGKG